VEIRSQDGRNARKRFNKPDGVRKEPENYNLSRRGGKTHLIADSEKGCPVRNLTGTANKTGALGGEEEKR